MTDDPKNEKTEYEVGHGKPPLHSQFKEGQSGNPNGRPKMCGAAKVDMEEIFNQTVTVVQGGVQHTMSQKEVSLRAFLKKAVEKRDCKTITYLLDQFIKYQAIDALNSTAGGVLELPSTMPCQMGLIMVEWFGEPPWTARQIREGRESYIATRSDDQRIEDELLDYPDLRDTT